MAKRPLMDKSVDELHLMVERGRGAVKLMTENPFFKDTLVPALETELNDLEKSLVWQPGSTDKDVTQIGVDRVWRSGIVFGIGKIWVKLNQFKNEGKEAEKELGVRNV